MIYFPRLGRHLAVRHKSISRMLSTKQKSQENRGNSRQGREWGLGAGVLWGQGRDAL